MTGPMMDTYMICAQNQLCSSPRSGRTTHVHELPMVFILRCAISTTNQHWERRGVHVECWASQPPRYPKKGGKFQVAKRLRRLRRMHSIFAGGTDEGVSKLEGEAECINRMTSSMHADRIMMLLLRLRCTRSRMAKGNFAGYMCTVSCSFPSPTSGAHWEVVESRPDKSDLHPT
jgi:hypothetical protein